MTQKNQSERDEVLDLTNDAVILMCKIRLDMSQHTFIGNPFPRMKRMQVYTAIEEMKTRLSFVNTDTMKSSISSTRFIIFRAKFLMFEHEVIDFVNLFHVRAFERAPSFEQDVLMPRRKSLTSFGTQRY